MFVRSYVVCGRHPKALADEISKTGLRLSAGPIQIRIVGPDGLLRWIWRSPQSSPLCFRTLRHQGPVSGSAGKNLFSLPSGRTPGPWSCDMGWNNYHPHPGVANISTRTDHRAEKRDACPADLTETRVRADRRRHHFANIFLLAVRRQ